MAKGKREVPGINSSSTADIAFIILIFFLVTTSMDTDRGLARQLPPPPENKDIENIIVKERNVLVVLLNAQDQLMAGKEYVKVSDLRKMAKDFIANPYNDEKLPEKKAKDVPFFGNTMVTENHVISLQNDRGTTYQAYINVQNELVAAYNELRNELAQEKWQKDYEALDEEQKKAIRMIYPQKISEAEPKNYGGKK
ncbi:biopolymer transporter ExbD [Bacteroides sp. 51]|uniref:ExbD/TolR family protein n=1 Tax=Bacteroides sp. 51 TaxID=2302938 RepID=UPI0013D3CB8A|nr:biopolymer transporter ExbD [Bacteroides sp. 51]NDV82425.1 biopolymer transporter ExbD [Bacteroides sp. 51]